jgi:lambda family phage minor tail protein L
VKNLSAIEIAAKEQLRDEKGFIWLYEIPVPTSPITRYRLTNYTEPIAHGTNSLGAPLIFEPAPIVHGGIQQSAEGDQPRIQVTVGNVSREIMDTLDLYNGLIGQTVDVRLVYLGAIAATTEAIHEKAEITGCLCTNETVAFTLSSYNLYRARFPSRRYLAKHCRFAFGGPECGYNLALGGFTTCTKTIEACTERGDDEVATSQQRQHPERFGAFQGIPRLSRAS